MKRQGMRLKFCKGDVFAIILVTVIALLVSSWFFKMVGNEPGNVVSIYQDGKLIQQLPLDQDTTMTIEAGYKNEIVVKDGKAAIAESDCPGADCVHSGWIREPGRSIVCLPNCVEIRIEGTPEVDFVVR